MQEMIGIVASVVIGAVILLAVALIQWRGQHTSIDATQFVAAKTGVLDFARVVEEDVSNLGAGLTVPDMLNQTNPTGYTGSTANQGGFTTTSAAFDTSSATRTVEFYSWAPADPITTDIASPLATSTYTIRYQWAATGNTVLVLNPNTGGYVTTPTYLIERYVDGAKTGESVNTITQLRFDLFNATGATTATLADVRQIEVTLMAVSPLGGGQAGMIDTEAGVAPAVSESRWNKMFRPANLARTSG